MKRVSTTALTLNRLRKEGWRPWVVERWIPFVRGSDKDGMRVRGGIRKDLFGIVDIEAVSLTGHLYVQTCRLANLAEHVKKACDDLRDGYVETFLLLHHLRLLEDALRAEQKHALDQEPSYQKKARAFQQGAEPTPRCALEVWGWDRKGPAGKRKLWQPTVRVLEAVDGRIRVAGDAIDDDT